MLSLAYAMGMLLALTREQPRAAIVAPELAPMESAVEIFRFSVILRHTPASRLGR